LIESKEFYYNSSFEHRFVIYKDGRLSGVVIRIWPVFH